MGDSVATAKALFAATTASLKRYLKTSLTTLVDCMKQMQDVQHNKDTDKGEALFRDIEMLDAICLALTTTNLPSEVLLSLPVPDSAASTPVFAQARTIATQISLSEKEERIIY